MTEDDRLEDLFAGARAAAPAVPHGLAERVVADADALMPRRRAGAVLRGWRAFGGAPGWAGLATATCVGFWLGVADPGGLSAHLALDAGRAVVAQEVDPDGTDTLAALIDPYGFGWTEEEDG